MTTRQAWVVVAVMVLTTVLVLGAVVYRLAEPRPVWHSGPGDTVELLP